MRESIIVALITGGMSLVGTIVTVLMASRKTDANLITSQAVTDTKIDELTREVREHNNFAKRMPVVEEQVKMLQHQVDDLKKSAG